ncbi:MAG: hypothetical protein EOP04_03800 [Proteobacteria bacterium]|nr:MAG: hypothetical protein EOP04_03800 [Pseudomonadota bacterium]
MAKLIFMSVALVSLIGCGKDNKSETASDPLSPLAGTWLLQINDKCGLGFTVNNGIYTRQLLCLETETKINVQVEAGTITSTGSTMTTASTKHSCPGFVPSTLSNNYSFNSVGTALNIYDEGQILTFAKFVDNGQSSAGGTVITMGCYDAEGVFTPNPNYSLSESERENIKASLR